VVVCYEAARRGEGRPVGKLPPAVSQKKVRRAAQASRAVAGAGAGGGGGGGEG